MGLVFNIQRFSVHDGPGIRTVVFLKGCPLHCLWCHNPEGISSVPQLLADSQRCIRCGECAVCPNDAHLFVAENAESVPTDFDTLPTRHVFLREKCSGCGLCASVCPTGALTLAGTKMTAEDVLTEVLKDKAFFEQSGGGITLSGGEPLFQPAFSEELLCLSKKEGLHTCMETSGFASGETMLRAAKWVDLFLYDFKASDEDLHQKVTGVPLAPVLDNLRTLNRLGNAVILRCPIIPGINDKEKHLQAIAVLAEAHSCIREIHLEPYHALGISKSQRLGQSPAYERPEHPGVQIESLCAQLQTMTGCRVIVS